MPTFLAKESVTQMPYWPIQEGVEKREWDASSIREVGIKHATEIFSSQTSRRYLLSVFCPNCWGFMVPHPPIHGHNHGWAECGLCGQTVNMLGAHWYRGTRQDKRIDFERVSLYEGSNAIELVIPQEMYDKYIKPKVREPINNKYRQEYKGDWDPDADYEQMLKDLKEK